MSIVCLHMHKQVSGYIHTYSFSKIGVELLELFVLSGFRALLSVRMLWFVCVCVFVCDCVCICVQRDGSEGFCVACVHL